MYDQLDSMQAAVDAVQDIPEFGYVDTALDEDTGIPGHNEYSDSNVNNIPLTDGTELSLQEREKGFRDRLSALSRAFFTHFFGRSSFNINKMKRLFSDMLDTCKADYAHNFRKWDSTATYMEDDVCFLVTYGIRYCFKSLVDDNTDPIEAHADGTLSYDSTKWVLLTEVRDVRHPVGKPFLWLGGTLPDNYICFSDGAQRYWADYPELDNPEFRALLTRFTRFGARANDTAFNVPSINELYPMSTAELPDQVSMIPARVPAHYHNLVSGTVDTNSTTSTKHSHPMSSSNDAGSHRHYTGRYRGGTGQVISGDGAWHEYGQNDGTLYRRVSFGWEEYDEIYVGIDLTPKLAAVTMNPHTVSAPAKTLSHTHSGTVTPAGAGDFEAVPGKYRPGTVKAVLVVRAG